MNYHAEHSHTLKAEVSEHLSTTDRTPIETLRKRVITARTTKRDTRTLKRGSWEQYRSAHESAILKAQEFDRKISKEKGSVAYQLRCDKAQLYRDLERHRTRYFSCLRAFNAASQSLRDRKREYRRAMIAMRGQHPIIGPIFRLAGKLADRWEVYRTLPNQQHHH